MGLLTDGRVSTIGDLQRYESSIRDVASTEDIDLDVKLDLAQEEIGIELQAMIGRQAGWSVAGGGPLLQQVVATAPLRQWHRLYTLALVFRDCYHNQLNDRYQAKWQEYEGLAQQARDRLVDIGIGYVYQPVARPAAPVVDSVSGSNAGATYYVQITAVTGAGVESAASDMASYTTGDSSQLRVTPSGLPIVAAGWNVYAGTTDSGLSRQNTARLGLTDTWRMPGSALVSGTAVPSGQEPEAYVTGARNIRRG